MGEGLAYGEGDVWAAWLVHLSDHAYTHCDDAEPWAAIALPSRAGLHDRGPPGEPLRLLSHSTGRRCPRSPDNVRSRRRASNAVRDSAIEHPERPHSTREPFLREMRLSRRLRRTRARRLLRLA